MLRVLRTNPVPTANCVIIYSMDPSLDPIPISYEDLLHQVFDQSTAGFQVIDNNWKYIFVNETVATQGKSEVHALMGHTMMEMYPGIENTPLFTQLKKCMEEKATISMENEFTYPDGSKGWFQLFIHPWAGGIMIFSVDITGRKLAEEKLSQKIEELEKMVGPEVDKQKVLDLKDALAKLRQPEVVVK